MRNGTSMSAVPRLFCLACLACLATAVAPLGACGGSAGAGTGFGADGASSGGGSSGGPFDAGDDAVTGTVSDGGVDLMLGDTGASSGGMGTGTCKNGTYSGTFQCTFMFDPDGGAASLASDAGGLMITGNISFNLAQATGNGESFMDTASGSFMGTAVTFFAISADVGGTLNCNTGVFSGSLTNGMYSGFIFLNGSFSGPLGSQYNGTTFSFVNGTWLLSVPGEGSCPGTWTANYSGDL
jgi:hypothetical protein